MGFCGCSLRASSICAAVFGIVESIIGLIIATVWLSLGSYSIRFAERDVLGSRVLAVPEFVGVLVTILFSNLFWLVTSIVLIVGIVRESVRLHKFWVIVSTLVLISDIIGDIVLIVGYVRMLTSWPQQTYSALFDTFISLLLIGSKFVGFLIVNIFLMFYTYERAIEIQRGQPANAFIYGGQPQLAPGQSAGAVPFVVYPVREEVQNQTYRTGIPAVIQGGQQQQSPLVHEQAAATAPFINYSSTAVLQNPTYNPGIPVVEKVGFHPDQRY